jgi:hypothetical protein
LIYVLLPLLLEELHHDDDVLRGNVTPFERDGPVQCTKVLDRLVVDGNELPVLPELANDVLELHFPLFAVAASMRPRRIFLVQGS